MNGEVAVSLPFENGSYNQKPAQSPGISPTQGNNQATNNEVSSKITFVIN